MGKPELRMPPPYQRQNAPQPLAGPSGDHHYFGSGLECLQVCLRPFRTIENFFVAGFVAQPPPFAGDLLNQLRAAALHTHGELLFPEFPARALPSFFLLGMTGIYQTAWALRQAQERRAC